MVPTSWRVREGGDAMALMPRCYAARTGLVRLVGRLPVGMSALSDTAALGDRGTSVLERSCSARDEGRWCLLTLVFGFRASFRGACAATAVGVQRHGTDCWR